MVVTVPDSDDIVEGPDPAEVARLGPSIERLLPALEAFLAFDGPDRSVQDRAAWQAALQGPLPTAGAGLDEVLDVLERVIIPNGLRTGQPGFSAYIIGRATTAAVAAGVAAQVAGHMRYFLTPFQYVEQLALDWLAELCGVPATHTGVFSGGGSAANLLAMGAARQAAFEAIGIDASADGIAGGPPMRIYGSPEVHHTIHRAAGVLGLGRQAFVEVGSDVAGRVDPVALDRRLRSDRAAGITPMAIVAVAGSTATGAIDPIRAVADVAAEHGVWLHVDGAYGLPAAAVPELAEHFQGVERADSMIVDSHKWLGTPVGCGATYVRDERLLHDAFRQEPAPYLEEHSGSVERSQFDSHGTHWYDLGLELHAPARGVWVWATLREIGRDGVIQRIRRHGAFAERLGRIADEHDRLELMLPPELSVCCFRYRPLATLPRGEVNDLNETIVQRLRAETPYVPSTARVRGDLAIRTCFVNAATAVEDIDGLAAAVVRLGDELVGGASTRP